MDSRFWVVGDLGFIAGFGHAADEIHRSYHRCYSASLHDPYPSMNGRVSCASHTNPQSLHEDFKSPDPLRLPVMLACVLYVDEGICSKKGV